MNKIVFVTLMMADDMHKRHFPVDGNSLIEYSGETYYAINSVLAQTLKKEDNVKVILLETNAGEKAGKKNAELFENELNEKQREEIDRLDGTAKEKEILYNFLEQYHGVCESQENIMLLSMIPEFTNFSYKEANA